MNRFVFSRYDNDGVYPTHEHAVAAAQSVRLLLINNYQMPWRIVTSKHTGMRDGIQRVRGYAFHIVADLDNTVLKLHRGIYYPEPEYTRFVHWHAAAHHHDDPSIVYATGHGAYPLLAIYNLHREYPFTRKHRSKEKQHG